jgi:hypothetical protein
VWHANQYIHLVLTSDRAFRGEEVVMTAIGRFKYRVRKRLWRYRNRAFLGRTRRRFSRSNGESA